MKTEITTELKEHGTMGHKSSGQITKINVENIPCYSPIGIDSEERKTGQRLLISVYVDIDSSKITSSDTVNSTFSYVDIYKTVQETGKSPHSLIESLAEDIARAVLKHPLVSLAKIKVHKPHIPYPEFQGNVSVEIERRK